VSAAYALWVLRLQEKIFLEMSALGTPNEIVGALAA
jgi:hypothetical protein